ncbi:Pre-mRNA-processing ATP-dependent RNA helicase prp5 [Penicillium argentinense]|uniref:Pre-mRNA-processing ATP-dependent RNA helicase PRP5 n=1 Tax=Penicillium argentinense TaxID=1131581 RepID=A0A9W9FF39_9EURO|nr:Pre-mRNA-processing ATP-dependent RNA helicase prp5 [Penicillium argentinense]KAJ5098966.1 Pre-mRNA-processing ATP-dependent RNA helicase prp5 [Penicillium argentinense]
MASRNERSPSPAGSTHSSSRGSRRDRDDSRPERGRRDDERRIRFRPNPQVSRIPAWSSAWSEHLLEHGGAVGMEAFKANFESTQRDRYGRRDDNHYVPGDRSRYRQPSRDRRRADDRERNYHRRDDSRDRDRARDRDRDRERERRRREDSADLRHKSRREDSRDRDRSYRRRSRTRSPVPSKSSTPAPHETDEQKKVNRLAKLEAWKAKQSEQLAKKQEGEVGSQKILEAIDRKSGLSPAVGSPSTPVTPADLSASTGYAGKFDPKAVARNATAANATTGSPAVLGMDVTVPESARAPTMPTRTAQETESLKPQGSVGGFALGAKQPSEKEKPSENRDLGFDEEESTHKRLKELPSLALDDGNDYFDNDDGAEDGEFDNQEFNEEKARAAAEQRRQQLLKDQTNEDVAIADAPAQPSGSTAMEIDTNAEEEDLDPLDAYMAELNQQLDTPGSTESFGHSVPTKKDKEAGENQPEAFFGDDDGVDMTAVGNEDADDVLAMAKKKKKKDVPKVDHAKVDYESFRKEFYQESDELKEMSEEEVANLRQEMDGIKVRGRDVPKPVQMWAQCGLDHTTTQVINNLGYENLTSIQSQAIPAIMSGRDVIGVAKTGSGKTMAFLIPMFRHIRDQRPLRTMEGPIGLIMTPTRELASQIHKDCKPFLKAFGLRAVCAYGGAPIRDHIAELKRGAEIIVCTPGRMIDLLAANAGRVTNLARVTYCVLDEADRMFDMGFEPQVMKIMANIRPDRQLVLFSATFPTAMEALARKTLNKPVEIIVGGRSVITQIVEIRNEDQKFIRVLELLGRLYASDQNEDARSLIFVERQESADNLLSELMRKGYPCGSIHGGKNQEDRSDTISAFKGGVFPVMIATSVAARGLDVKQLKLVINYDVPNHLEDYVHRAGRTGRAGNTGIAVTFLTDTQERFAVDVVKALQQSNQEVPKPIMSMAESFLKKIKDGKEKSSHGFGGKGLERLDQERENARKRERRAFKTGDEEDEEDEEGKEDTADKGEDRFAKALSSVQSATTSTPTQIPGVPKGIDLDGHITVHKTEREPPGSKNTLDKVGSAVADINARLSKAGVMRSGVPIDNRGPDAGQFHATLEINDFPQKARWAVTNRTNVAKILEATGTSITTKGNFYPPGKEPGPNELPKLYILVEGETEISVTNAMRELMRLLKDGTMAAADSDARAPASGRYNVV